MSRLKLLEVAPVGGSLAPRLGFYRGSERAKPRRGLHEEGSSFLLPIWELIGTTPTLEAFAKELDRVAGSGAASPQEWRNQYAVATGEISIQEEDVAAQFMRMGNGLSYSANVREISKNDPGYDAFAQSLAAYREIFPARWSEQRFDQEQTETHLHKPADDGYTIQTPAPEFR